MTNEQYQALINYIDARLDELNGGMDAVIKSIEAKNDLVLAITMEDD